MPEKMLLSSRSQSTELATSAQATQSAPLSGTVPNARWRTARCHCPAARSPVAARTDEPPAVLERLKQILEPTERTGREARQAVAGIRASGESTDLVTLVGQTAQSIATQSGLSLSFNVKGHARSIRADVCDVAVAIVQEALTNVLTHARARRGKLSVTFGARTMRLSVRDDGQGVMPHEGEGTDAGHFGLVGMRERATSVGARFAVRSTPGRGMVVQLDAPYRGSASRGWTSTPR